MIANLKRLKIFYLMKLIRNIEQALVELVDLRSLSNFNYSKIFKSVRKTRRILIVEDGWKNLSISSEIITRISEKNISLKKAPKRICWPNSHVPMSEPLEKKFYFSYKDIVKECIKLVNINTLKNDSNF